MPTWKLFGGADCGDGLIGTGLRKGLAEWRKFLNLPASLNIDFLNHNHITTDNRTPHIITQPFHHPGIIQKRKQYSRFEPELDLTTAI